MSAIDALKSACLNKPFKSFKNLPISNDYIIERFDMVHTSFGDRIRIEMHDCFMFLPERFSRVLDQDALNKLNKSSVMMLFKGRDCVNNNRLVLDFESVPTFDDAVEATLVPIGQPN